MYPGFEVHSTFVEYAITPVTPHAENGPISEFDVDVFVLGTWQSILEAAKTIGRENDTDHVLLGDGVIPHDTVPSYEGLVKIKAQSGNNSGRNREVIGIEDARILCSFFALLQQKGHNSDVYSWAVEEQKETLLNYDPITPPEHTVNSIPRRHVKQRRQVREDWNKHYSRVTRRRRHRLELESTLGIEHALGFEAAEYVLWLINQDGSANQGRTQA